MKILNYFIEKRMIAGLLTVLILIAGSMALSSLNREAFPEVSFDMVTIQTVYPGASAEECENLITIPIEKEIRQVAGIDRVRSYNIENISFIVIYLEEGRKNPSKTVQDIKDAVGLVTNLPEEAKEPLVEELKLDKTELIYAAVYPKKDNVDYSLIRKTADDLEDFFFEIDGVAKIDSYGYFEKEYLAEIKPEAMKDYRFDLRRVVGALKTRNQDMPGGSIKLGDDEYILRMKSAFNGMDEIKKTILFSNLAGNSTSLGDVAKVSATYTEPDIIEHYNGKPAIILSIWKKKSADEIRLAEDLKARFKDFHNSNGDKVAIELFNDSSEHTMNNIDSVVTNAITGFILLAAILFLSMGYRIAALVTGGLPLAFMIAFVGMKFAGLTINVISLFGLIMVLGMIVDFSIVVAENAHRYMELGYEKVAAIKKGVEEVFWPVTVTLLSIIATFVPLLLVTGLIGKFIKAIPMVLIISLVASWFIAFFLLPSFLSKFLKDTSNPDGIIKDDTDEEQVFDRGFFRHIQKIYAATLTLALRFRYIAMVVLLMLFGVSLVLASKIGFVFITGGGSKIIEIKTTLPRTRNLEANEREIAKLEKIVRSLPGDELVSLRSRIGMHQNKITDPRPGQGSHKSHMFLFLTKEAERTRTAAEIAEDLRSKIKVANVNHALSSDLAVEVEVMESGPPRGKPVNVELRGKDFETLQKIAAEYTEFLSGVNGVRDIGIDLEKGKTEYRYRIDENDASRMGVSALDAATALFGSFEGIEATTIKEGEDDVPIRVRYPRDESRSRRILNEVMVANKTGGLIPLPLVTKMVEDSGYAGINRLNYKRVIQVQANVKTDVTTSLEVNRLLSKHFENIEAKYPGYSVSYGGEQEETRESMAQLGILFLIALFVIYMILTVFFNSLSIPIVIMSAIPFSLVGVIFALYAHGQPLSFMSVLGVFSLAGVIVSNTLVLVEFIMARVSKGRVIREALVEGGVIRLRPVLLTTGTTVLGLFPTIYGLGDKNYFVAPLALAFGYGLIFATFITMVLIPVMMHILVDIQWFRARLKDSLLQWKKSLSIFDSAMEGRALLLDSLLPSIERIRKGKRRN